MENLLGKCTGLNSVNLSWNRSVILTFIIFIFLQGIKSIKNRIAHNFTKFLSDGVANIMPFIFLILCTGHCNKQTLASVHNLNARNAERICKCNGNHSATIRLLVIDGEDMNISDDRGSGLSRIGGLGRCFLVSVHS
nr:MAG TPA: hypothetical protein [Caudoviricetes sp.]